MNQMSMKHGVGIMIDENQITQEKPQPCHFLHHLYKSTEICYTSICYSDVSCIGSKESTVTSEHMLC